MVPRLCWQSTSTYSVEKMEKIVLPNSLYTADIFLNSIILPKYVWRNPRTNDLPTWRDWKKFLGDSSEFVFLTLFDSWNESPQSFFWWWPLLRTSPSRKGSAVRVCVSVWIMIYIYIIYTCVSHMHTCIHKHKSKRICACIRKGA